MPKEPDMDAPVTRRELHSALDTWAGAIIEKVLARFDKVEARFAGFEARFDTFAAEMRALVDVTERRIRDDIKAIMEPHDSIPERMNRLEEQALPDRVSKLEARVFAPKQRATAARRKRS